MDAQLIRCKFLSISSESQSNLESLGNAVIDPSYPKVTQEGMPMPRTQRSTATKNKTASPAKAHVMLKGQARVLYEKFRKKSGNEHKELTEAIRASQCLSKEDFDIRINTRD